MVAVVTAIPIAVAAVVVAIIAIPASPAPVIVVPGPAMALGFYRRKSRRYRATKHATDESSGDERFECFHSEPP
jgi:hypothetical protein